MQAELFEGLGFKAERNEEVRMKKQEMKEMIYPHLRMQVKEKGCDKAGCSKGECAC